MNHNRVIELDACIEKLITNGSFIAHFQTEKYQDFLLKKGDIAKTLSLWMASDPNSLYCTEAFYLFENYLYVTIRSQDNAVEIFKKGESIDITILQWLADNDKPTNEYCDQQSIDEKCVSVGVVDSFVCFSKGDDPEFYCDSLLKIKLKQEDVEKIKAAFVICKATWKNSVK